MTPTPIEEALGQAVGQVTLALSKAIHELRESFTGDQKVFNVGMYIGLRILTNYARKYLIDDGASVERVAHWEQVADNAQIYVVAPQPGSSSGGMVN